MSEPEFYEEDEPVEKIWEAWERGEKGFTSGPRDLNQRARFIVDGAVARFEGRHVQVVASGTMARTVVRDCTISADP